VARHSGKHHGRRSTGDRYRHLQTTITAVGLDLEIDLDTVWPQQGEDQKRRRY
jgi:hypothetical protein